jgi:hypothetical protein
MVGRRGDAFTGNKKGTRSIPINPEEPNRADRFEFILRAMTGIDHLGEQINLHIYSQTLGLLEDVTADAAAIATDPKTKSSVIALNKAILLQSVAIKAATDLVKSAVDAVEIAVINVEGKIDATNLKLYFANINLNEIETLIIKRFTNLATLQTSVDNLNTKADEIKAILERNAAPETINAPGPQSISVTGQLAWLSWETPGSTGTTVTVSDGAGIVYTSLKTDGFISFNPPMPDLIYSISVVPTGGTATVINAGAI